MKPERLLSRMLWGASDADPAALSARAEKTHCARMNPDSEGARSAALQVSFHTSRFFAFASLCAARTNPNCHRSVGWPSCSPTKRKPGEAGV